MTCPHLKTYETELCVTDGKSYIPSSHQLGNYCKSGNRESCPLFIALRNNIPLFSYRVE